MREYRFSNAPRPLRRSAVHLDNITLLPASLLPFNAQWRAIANDVPQGQILIILPWQAKPQCVARFVASQLRERGKHVRVMDEDLQENAL